MKKKTPNAQDATLRNIRALKKRLDLIEAMIRAAFFIKEHHTPKRKRQAK